MQAVQARRQQATLKAIPSGQAGTRATLQIMSQLVRRYKKTLPMRELALSVVNRVNGHKNFSGEVRAVSDYVKNNIRYRKDVNGIETISTPIKTLEYRAGDCDDQAVLVATLLEAIGHPTRFVAIKMKHLGPFVHVYTETKIGPKWYSIETTESWPVGFQPPGVVRRMVWNN